MILQITLGDIIGWLITLTSVGIAVSINIRINNNVKKINQKNEKGINMANMS